MLEQLNLPDEEAVVADRIRSQWRDLIGQLGGDMDLVDLELQRLLAAYQARGSDTYHNLRHIGDVDEFLTEYQQLAKNFPALKLAADGHDVIYQPKSNTNEEDSAEFMKDLLTNLGIEEAIIEEVSRIILLTKDHHTTEDDIDGQLMIDADFSILAAGEEAYKHYLRGIWQEYVGSGIYTPEEFKQGRSEIIKKWLASDRLFLIEEIRDELEFRARANLERELQQLARL